LLHLIFPAEKVTGFDLAVFLIQNPVTFLEKSLELFSKDYESKKRLSLQQKLRLWNYDMHAVGGRVYYISYFLEEKSQDTTRHRILREKVTGFDLAVFSFQNPSRKVPGIPRGNVTGHDT